jgi:hypothetical protein
MVITAYSNWLRRAIKMQRTLHKRENTKPFVTRILQGSPGQPRHNFAPLPKRNLLMLAAPVVPRECQVGTPSIPV